jgi:poly(hydroxyalkanoate) depolymerase family esterase
MTADMPPHITAIADSAGVGQFLSRQIETAEGTRTYKLFVPSGYDQRRPAPLLVVLHGCTQDPDDISRGTRFNALAEQKGFLVAYPEQPQKYNALKCWNWFDAAHQVRAKGEPALIASIAQRVMTDYSVDTKRIFIAGVSAGGAMALTVAYAYPELFAAAGIHSGIAYGSATSIANALTAMRSGAADSSTLASSVRNAMGSARSFPAIVFQGKADKSVNFINAEQIVSQLSQAFVPPLTKLVEVTGEANGYHYRRRTVGSDKPYVEEWIVDELGHAWSGGSKEGTYADPGGPDASSEMIRFFLENPRR